MMITSSYLFRNAEFMTRCVCECGREGRGRGRERQTVTYRERQKKRWQERKSATVCLREGVQNILAVCFLML